MRKINKIKNKLLLGTAKKIRRPIKTGKYSFFVDSNIKQNKRQKILNKKKKNLNS